ncbi:MAG: hypothetical protein JO320_04565 [Alphaproteobacteria bacterium]|nr:hypothetical protein [Alphaproteobacteria bacterium]MBV9374321.1 hypothetical protein [Alphaproteobacteria bacterium]
MPRAERHVREAEERIARQHEIIAELDRDGHQRMAAKARQLLAAFQQTLDLAHHHVRRERREKGLES